MQMSFFNKPATTQEFRNAMYKAIWRLKVKQYKSWTEVLPEEKSSAIRSDYRMVCFKLKGCPVNTEAVAFLAEHILNEEGKTANVRVGTRNKNYIRAFCKGVNYRKDPIRYPEFHEYKGKDLND